MHRVKVRVVEDALDANNTIARANRADFDAHDVTVINLMSSPGAGKTTLLERTVREVGSEIPIGVIEGDQATLRDAERMRAVGCPVVQVNTGSGCHLDAAMIDAALHRLDPPPHSLVVIENVGNLVCPALFDLGERLRVVLMSVTEGDDKPLKYPHMFHASDVMVLTKADLLPHVEFDVARCREFAQRVNPRLTILELSATRGDGLDAWYALLRGRLTSSALPLGA